MQEDGKGKSVKGNLSKMQVAGKGDLEREFEFLSLKQRIDSQNGQLCVNQMGELS
jgi:hypothetical protein